MIWMPEEERRTLQAEYDVRQQIARKAAAQQRQAEEERLRQEEQRELDRLQRGEPAARPPWR